ncbi:acyltransferase family protein [Mucilaginibacter sp.]|uniref:acyltransferase family protein n=1 Tax=Mucilaginibacter sp. TaxID=1882438 RepID=UPI0035BC3976
MQVLILLSFLGFFTIFQFIDVPQGDVVIAFFASLVIVNLCEPKTSIIGLKNKTLKYCGKISYSIYLLHKFPLYLVLFIAGKYLAHAGLLWQNVFIFTATIVLVIALGTLSYYGYERYFLKLKNRFQKITRIKAPKTIVNN